MIDLMRHHFLLVFHHHRHPQWLSPRALRVSHSSADSSEDLSCTSHFPSASRRSAGALAIRAIRRRALSCAAGLPLRPIPAHVGVPWARQPADPVRPPIHSANHAFTTRALSPRVDTLLPPDISKTTDVKDAKDVVFRKTRIFDKAGSKVSPKTSCLCTSFGVFGKTSKTDRALVKTLLKTSKDALKELKRTMRMRWEETISNRIERKDDENTPLGRDENQFASNTQAADIAALPPLSVRSD
ncbi:hypothetical protein DFH06DRAFT_1143723 [Mycena polygramma]|nr:hypothetical protein DFH06DRAFT_1143723 [Mycena polygramma]